MFGCKTSRTRLSAAIRGLALLAAAALVVAQSHVAHAQVVNQAIGGVWINVNGVLLNVDPDFRPELRAARLKALGQMPGNMNQQTKLRMVSLSRLQDAITACQKAGTPLPDEIRYLAGLQRVKYVFVMPELHDIVLAGPADGWTINNVGDVVGAHNGEPVLQLDDLLVALRSADAARSGGISCSINPTPEGVKSVQAYKKYIRAGDDLDSATRDLERLLGPQNISVTGVPASSRFAHVLVAADYQMKRLGMHFDESPVKGLKSYLEMIPGGARPTNMMPRWWMAASYQPLAKDPEGLAWELRGQGVKCMAEEDFINSLGEAHGTGKANPLSQKWADTMTAKFDELSDKFAIFREAAQLHGFVGRRVADRKGRHGRQSRLPPDAVDGRQAIADRGIQCSQAHRQQSQFRETFARLSDQRFRRRAIPAVGDHPKPQGRRRHQSRPQRSHRHGEEIDGLVVELIGRFAGDCIASYIHNHIQAQGSRFPGFFCCAKSVTGRVPNVIVIRHGTREGLDRALETVFDRLDTILRFRAEGRQDSQ